MVVNKIKVFPKVTKLGDMKSINSTSGFYLDDVILTEQYPTYVEETLYTSLNQIRFHYPIKGVNVGYVKNGNHVLYPTPTGYNLYTIDNISITTDEDVIQVDAQHYSMNYMRDSAHELANGSNASSIESINDTLRKSVFVSEDFKLLGTGEADGRYTLTDDTYISSLASATVGSALVGTNSLLRRYYGQYLRRNLDHLEAFKVEKVNGLLTEYPIVLGINVRDMNYTIDTSDIYTTAIVSANSIPDIRIQGAESIGGKLNGIGGSIWPTLADMDDNIEFSAVYKGLPLLFVKKAGVITVSLTKLVDSSGELINSIAEAVVTYVNGVLKITRFDQVILEESINPSYFYGVDVHKIGDSESKTLQYLGKDPFIKEQGYKYTTVLPASTVQYALRADTDYKGNSVRYVDYEPDDVSNEDGLTGLTFFYLWHLKNFKNYWLEEDNAKLLEPTFEAKFTIDDMKTLFGESVVNTHIFRVGDLYNVDAQDYVTQFNAAITKTKYNGLTGEVIEIEFGNKQDTVLEVLKSTNTNKPDKRKDTVNSSSGGNKGTSSGSGSVGKTTDTKPVITLRESKINYQGDDNLAVFEDNLISAYDKEDGDITYKVVITQTGEEATYSVTDSDGNTVTKKATIEYLGGGGGGFDEDEMGSWLDIVMNGDDIRTDKELFDGDLPYETMTDDTGIPRMEWEPPFVTISPDGEETTPSKLVCYNGSEAVISEVKYKGDYDRVRLNANGGFRDNSDFLPDNVGFQIVPHPTPGVGGRVEWTPVFSLLGTEGFNKDTTHGVFPYRDRDDSTVLDVEQVKENLGYRYNYALNATTQGTIKFEVEWVKKKRYLRELHKLLGGNNYDVLYQVKDMDEFRKSALDLAIGKTVTRKGYNGNYPNEDQSLAYYVKQVEEGEQPYLRSVYRQFLLGIAGNVYQASASPALIGDILTVEFEETGIQHGAYKVKRIISIDFDEDALERQTLGDGPLLKEERGWQKLVFTQPTTKVNDQIVKVNNLLITNDGVSAKNAIISKSVVDQMWAKLSDEERKEFERTYGKEWLFNLKYTPNQYESDNVLFGSFYRAHNKLKPPGIIDPFGLGASLIKQDEKRALKVAERYQQKYNYMLSIGYTLPQSTYGQTIYNKVEAYYKSQQTPIEP